LWKILFSNSLTLKTIENFYQVIKRYEELWRVDDRAQSGRLKSLRAQAAMKTVLEQIY
jgi:hypothetical protein